MKSEDELTGSISTEKGFGGYRVVAFEARFAQEMAKLIASHGGELPWLRLRWLKCRWVKTSALSNLQNDCFEVSCRLWCF